MTITSPNIITRDGARALGLKRYFTGKPCTHGHVAERWMSGGKCTVCRREWRAANLEKVKERDRERARRYRAADPERARENWRRWRDAHPQARRMWQIANKDKISKRQAAQRRAGRAESELNGAGLTGL